MLDKSGLSLLFNSKHQCYFMILKSRQTSGSEACLAHQTPVIQTGWRELSLLMNFCRTWSMTTELDYPRINPQNSIMLRLSPCVSGLVAIYEFEIGYKRAAISSKRHSKIWDRRESFRIHSHYKANFKMKFIVIFVIALFAMGSVATIAGALRWGGHDDELPSQAPYGCWFDHGKVKCPETTYIPRPPLPAATCMSCCPRCRRCPVIDSTDWLSSSSQQNGHLTIRVSLETAIEINRTTRLGPSCQFLNQLIARIGLQPEATGKPIHYL